MYPQTPEQSHANMSWAEAAYSSGGYYTSQPQTSQTPPGSPDYTPGSEGHYPGSLLYYTDSKTHTQSGRLFLAHNRLHYEQLSQEHERAGSDTPSDSEAHTPGYLLST